MTIGTTSWPGVYVDDVFHLMNDGVRLARIQSKAKCFMIDMRR